MLGCSSLDHCASAMKPSWRILLIKRLSATWRGGTRRSPDGRPMPAAELEDQSEQTWISDSISSAVDRVLVRVRSLRYWTTFAAPLPSMFAAIHLALRAPAANSSSARPSSARKRSFAIARALAARAALAWRSPELVYPRRLSPIRGQALRRPRAGDEAVGLVFAPEHAAARRSDTEASAGSRRRRRTTPR